MVARMWPALDTPGWLDTSTTLHLWTQIVGKTRLALAAPMNHWWHVSLYVSAIGLATGVLVMIAWSSGVFPWSPWPASRAGAVLPQAPLPVPSASEVSLARARSWSGIGRLRDALTALDAIRPGDPLRPQADELRAAIQRQLLAAARATASPAR